MSDFEQISCGILILVYGVTCYLAGKGDLLTLIPMMLADKMKQIEKDGEDDS